MEWKFDKEHRDQIIYCMENQDRTFLLDLRTGNVVSESKIDGSLIGDRYHRLPLWRSLEGFQLMERFVTTIRNPIFREELRQAISTGSGVFRNFKGVLKKRKELEKLWFAFKEREMTAVVYDWFNQLREMEGLEKLTPPSEETEELVSSDFIFVEEVEDHLEDLFALDRDVYLESYPGRDESRILEYHRMSRAKLPPPDSDDSLVLIAETPGGDFVGFAWAVEKDDPPNRGTVIDLIQLAVIQEYQGLGLGQALLKRLLGAASKTDAERVRIHLTGRFLGAAKLFELRGFEVSAQNMELDLSKLERWQF